MRRARGGVTVVIVALLLLGVGYVQDRAVSTQSPSAWRPAAADEHHSRILPAAHSPAGSGGYAFEQVQRDGSPVSYDPCRPLHYVVNLRGAPPGSREMVRQAISRIEAATGLLFVNDGLVTESANPHRRPVQPGRYGKRWAPVLIAWARAQQEPELAGYIAGSEAAPR